jgi:four helix bundle protein
MAGWKSVEEIIAYQLSVQLRDRITALARDTRIARDFTFRDQIVGAAASAPSNISEGFERYKHGEFGFFVGIAKASLGELKTHLIDARTRGYLDPDEVESLLALTSKAKATTNGLLRHLKTSKAPTPWQDSSDD